MHGKIRNALKKLPVLAAAVLALGAFATPAWAADGPVTVKDEAGLREALEAGGEISIDKDATIGLTEPVVVTGNTTLSGTGTIKLDDTFDKSESEAPITVQPNATLTINGVKLDGNGRSYGYRARQGAMLYVAGELKMTSGGISNVFISKKDGSTSEMAAVYIATDGKFEMTGGIIENNTIWGENLAKRGVVCIAAGGYFELDGDGKLTENTAATGFVNGAVVLVLDSQNGNTPGMFNMQGGSISGNKSTAVQVGYTSGEAEPAVFNLSGGTIADNTITQTYGDNDASGGFDMNPYSAGVLVKQGAFTMSGGTISGNTSGRGAVDQDESGIRYDSYGGGVCVLGISAQSSFHMKGGVISGNHADSGAGIFVTKTDGAPSPKILLEEGDITDNIAAGSGGGVYVVKGCVVNLQNVVVKDNDASLIGGGIWTCATGNVKTYIENGGAVFNNTAGEGTVSAGDDLAFVKHIISGENADFKVSERIIGGGKVCYYKDGGVIAGGYEWGGDGSHSYLGESDGTDRYDPEKPGEAVKTEELNVSADNFALKSSASDEARAAASDSAKLTIASNTAKRGGGIGANGDVVIGAAPDEGEDEEDYSLKVTKQWEGVEADDQGPVEVALVSIIEKDGVKKEYELDTVKLEVPKWTGEFKGLPKGEYKVKEKNIPDGFTAVVSPTVLSEDSKSYQVTVTNTKIKDGSLSIEKEVTGTKTDRAFLFDATLKEEDGKPLSDTYKATIYDGADKTGSAEVTFENGKSVRVDYKDKTSVNAISLKHGQKIVIEGIPAGATYTVSERYASDFNVAIDTPTGTIAAGQTSAVTVTNTYDPYIPPTPPVDNDGDLDIEKKVVGEGAPDVEFTFTVTLDRKLNGTYGDAIFKDGVATITLKAGETAHIEGLPKGTKYTVTEAASKHFTSSIKNGSGTITAGTVKVTATNTYEPPTDIAVELDPGKKYLEGRELNEGEFTFELWDGNTLIATSTNSVDPSDRHFGSFSFSFKQAPNTTKTYVMKERKGDLEGVTYDDRVYEVTVMTDGEGVKSVEYSPDFYENGAVFWNKYTPDKPEEPKPENPKPEQPKPEQPERPSGELPQTGDSSLSAGVLATVAVAGVALAGAGVTLLKKHSR